MKCDYLLLHHHIVDYKLHLASRTLYMWISLDYYIDSQQRILAMAVTMFMVSRFDSEDGMQVGIPANVWKQKQSWGVQKRSFAGRCILNNMNIYTIVVTRLQQKDCSAVYGQ